MPCVIARHINGITLNEYEYVLNDDGEVMIFNDKKQATSFLINNGATSEEIESYRYFNYCKLQKGVYEGD